MQKRIDASTMELQERLVSINRVAKTVKGGRNMRFSALMVVGDGNGHVGVGMGKAVEIPEAVRKGIEDAKRHLIEVPIVGTSIPHAVEGKFGKGHVRMIPAEEGTGVIAGGPPVRFWKWPASRIFVPRALAPTTPQTALRPPSMVSASFAPLRRSPSFAVRP